MNELFLILSEPRLSWEADLVAVEVVGLLSAFAVFVDVVSIGETAQSFAVLLEMGDQLVNTAAGIDFGKQQPCVAG